MRPFLEYQRQVFSCLECLLKVIRMLVDIAFQVQAAIEQGPPNLHIERIEKVPDGKQCTVKEPLSGRCPHRDEEALALEYGRPELSHLDQVFLHP